MKASILVLGGLVLVSAGLSGCEDYYNHYYPYDVSSQKARQQACVALGDPPGGRPPQIMTYDTNSKTETHVDTQGRDISVSAQNNVEKSSLAMNGKVGDTREPVTCTDLDDVGADPSAGSQYKPKKKDHHQDDSGNY